MPNQHELPLPFPELTGDQPLLPARMVNEYVYCPRLAYLEWVQGEWASSADTVDGSRKHARVDTPGGELPAAEDIDAETRIHARSITLASNRLGVIAKLDLLEADDGEVVPIDYKRGKRPHVARGAYDPERVQLCLQGLILEDQGYRCSGGVLYFVESRERVPVAFDDELRGLALSSLHGLRGIALGGRIPTPLEDSPKCPRCALVSICLPDEVNFLRPGAHPNPGPPRAIAIGLTEALPLYVQANKAKVAKDGENLAITIDDQAAARPRLAEISQVVLQGNVYVTTPTLHELMRREIPIAWHSYGGWFLGHTAGVGHKNVELRIAQFRAADDDKTCLALARGWVRAKLVNSRVLLRRNWRGEQPPEAALAQLEHAIKTCSRARDLPELLGIEGNGAAAYFGAFAGLLKREDNSNFGFDFSHRNRRPPTDPVNALLSFAYAMLTRAFTIALTTTGFDPYRGYYHQPRYGRPALALDMMEPFRPLIADSAVLQAINNGEVRPTDFIGGPGRTNLSEEGRKRFIATFERRLAHEVTHPQFSYRISYRRLLELQCRLLGRFLLGETVENHNFTTR
ncbi:MAG: CRISPR-associated endonuclease Cas1 [Nevskia sp.]|jgi:CRISPR-associated exonuclease Cas4/CRISPR-associated protein Cas1|nr:CRISPR-associated endonuclease Cas1 [Nevskia sp.]MCK9386532.1 CRISPR-associated endonuclease Cas1 [Nevskia sp.]